MKDKFLEKEKPAILGGEPEFFKKLPVYNTIGKQEIDAAVSVMKSGVLSGYVANSGEEFFGGDVIVALENAFCKRFSSKYAVSVNSATSGLHSALVAAGVEQGDEVIVPPYTMSASATTVVMCGAKPVFVDIEPDMFCLDISKVIDAITAKTKAIMSVNLFGQPANLGALRNIADKYNLILIEDNAQSPGAIYKEESTGTIGDLGVFSLNRHKTMQCGEGGVVVCNNKRLAHKLRMIRNHGESVLPEWPQDKVMEGDESIIGFNYRLTSLQASIAISQLGRLDELNKQRVVLAKKLSTMLSEFNFLQSPVVRENCSHVFYLYPMIFDKDKIGISRDQFLFAMQKEGAPVSNYVRPLYRLPLYAHKFGQLECYDPDNFPNVEGLWKDKMVTTNICRPPLSEEHIYKFINAIRKIYKYRKEIIEYFS
jgi:perosamine synthetase